MTFDPKLAEEREKEYERIRTLYRVAKKAGRNHDFDKSMSDKVYLRELLREYGLAD